MRLRLLRGTVATCLIELDVQLDIIARQFRQPLSWKAVVAVQGSDPTSDAALASCYSKGKASKGRAVLMGGDNSLGFGMLRSRPRSTRVHCGVAGVVEEQA